jgi:hypothetical protein
MKMFNIEYEYNLPVKITITPTMIRNIVYYERVISWSFDNRYSVKTNNEKLFYKALGKIKRKGYYLFKDTDKHILDEGLKKYPEFFI